MADLERFDRMKDLEQYLQLVDEVIASALKLTGKIEEFREDAIDVDPDVWAAAKRLYDDLNSVEDHVNPKPDTEQPLLKFGPGGDYVTEVHGEDV